MIKLLLILIIAGGNTTTIPLSVHETFDSCHSAGAEWLMQPAGNGIVMGFACQTITEEG